jgi:hypothetical protein
MFRFRKTADIIRQTATDLSLQQQVLDDLPEGMKRIADFQREYYNKYRLQFKNESQNLLQKIYTQEINPDNLIKILDSIICPT